MDFREVISVGSTAIGFLVAIYSSVTKHPDGRFVLVGAQPRVREVLDGRSSSQRTKVAPAEPKWVVERS